MIHIRHRTNHDITIVVGDDQTPKWFISMDGSTYSKDEWEPAPPPGKWEDITAQVVLEEKGVPAQGRVNFYYNAAGTHNIRIGYLQFKGAYRVLQTPKGQGRVELRIERRIDE